MKEDQIRAIIREELNAMRIRIISQFDILPKTIKQRHIDGVIIFFGLAADLPSGGTEVKAYYATDTDVLYLWDDSAWQSH
jgi:hypothetical protein